MNLEKIVQRSTKTGEITGGFSGSVAGALYGPSILGKYITGTTLGYSNAAIAGSFLGTVPGMVLGYAALNTGYKLVRDTLRTTYNTFRHPINSVKSLGATIKSCVTRPYRIITKPFTYVFKPAFMP